MKIKKERKSNLKRDIKNETKRKGNQQITLKVNKNEVDEEM